MRSTTTTILWVLILFAGVRITLAQNIEYVSSTLWSDVGDVKISGNYAYCAFVNGLVVLDISDPTEPVIYSQKLLPSYGGEIDVAGDYAYYAYSYYGAAGLKIINIGDPANPEVVGGCESSGWPFGVFVYGDYAYLAWGYTGVRIVHIADPANPTFVASFDTPGTAQRVFVSADYAYVADRDAGLQIFNVSDPINPVPAGSYQSPFYANDVWVSGTYAFLATGVYGWGAYGDLEIIDVSDPGNPSLIEAYGGDAMVSRVFASSNYAFFIYSSLTGGGMKILDISDPHVPVLMFDHISSALPRAFSIAGNQAIVNWGRKLYGWAARIETIDISDLQNPVHEGNYSVPDRAYDIFLSGNHVYVADDEAGLQIVDISDPAAPVVAGRFEDDGRIRYVCVSGNYACVTAERWGSGSRGWFDIADISDPSDPDLLSSFTHNCTGGTYWFEDVFISGDYAYNVCLESNILIWDISNIRDPILIANFMTSDHARRIFKTGNFLYIANYFDGLIIFNVSDPYGPVFAGECSIPGQACDVFASGDYVYVAAGTAGLQIVNISDPTQPHIVASRATPDSALSVVVSSDYAYMAVGDSGAQVINITDPLSPNLVGSYDTPGHARAVAVSDDYIYLTDYYSLMILRFNSQTEVEEIGGRPGEFALMRNYPNPFNATTKIDFDIPTESEVDMSVYDLLGRRVAMLLQGQSQPGHHSLIWNAGDVPSGIYFATLRTGSHSQSIRMTLLK